MLSSFSHLSRLSRYSVLRIGKARGEELHDGRMLTIVGSRTLHFRGDYDIAL